jgi:hypothetical protein
MDAKGKGWGELVSVTCVPRGEYFSHVDLGRGRPQSLDLFHCAQDIIRPLIKFV